MPVPAVWSSHEQVKLPSVFVQVVFSPQVWDPILHSSISVTQRVLQLEGWNASEHRLKEQQLQHCTPQTVGKNTKDLSLCKYVFMESIMEKQPAYFLVKAHSAAAETLHGEKEGNASPRNATSTAGLNRRLICTRCILLALLVIACSLDPYVGILVDTQQKSSGVGSCPLLYHPSSSA